MRTRKVREGNGELLRHSLYMMEFQEKRRLDMHGHRELLASSSGRNIIVIIIIVVIIILITVVVDTRSLARS